MANGAHAIRAAREATTAIPIVMAAAGDPLREGHVPNLARPGGNVTGLSLFPQGRMEPKQLELLKEAVPRLTQVGVLANRNMGDAATEEISAAARTLGLQLQTVARRVRGRAHACCGPNRVKSRRLDSGEESRV